MNLSYCAIWLKRPLLVVSLLMVLSACEKDITVDLPEAEPKVIVEGYIAAGEPAYVFLSRLTSFFEPTDSLALLESAIRGATVVVSDGITSDTLLEPLPGVGYLYISANMRRVGNLFYLVFPSIFQLTLQTYHLDT